MKQLKKTYPIFIKRLGLEKRYERIKVEKDFNDFSKNI